MRDAGPAPPPEFTPAEDAVERAVVARALAPSDRLRILDVGCGRGRMSTLAERTGGEYVGIDLDRGRLLEAQRSSARPARSAFLRGGALRLPFRSAEFSAVLLVRLTHRFADIGPILRETHRVLRPGGLLIVSFNPNPSLGTFLQDLGPGIRFRTGSHWVSCLPGPVVQLIDYPQPAYLMRRSAIRRSLLDAGFEGVECFGTGFERIRGLRRLPLNGLVTAASWRPLRWISPVVFYAVRRRPLRELGAG